MNCKGLFIIFLIILLGITGCGSNSPAGMLQKGKSEIDKINEYKDIINSKENIYNR